MSKRGLTPFEKNEAQLVFGGSLDLDRIHLHEQVAWPDRIAALGARLHHSPPPSHNAITLSNHIYFPIKLMTSPSGDGASDLSQMAWLIHELTHCWQYQHGGPGYFFKALWAQLRLGSEAYAYGWQAGLQQASIDGKSISDFNPEQQGEITRHYYYRLKQGLDIRAWQPWIQAIQAVPAPPA